MKRIKNQYWEVFKPDAIYLQLNGKIFIITDIHLEIVCYFRTEKRLLCGSPPTIMNPRNNSSLLKRNLFSRGIRTLSKVENCRTFRIRISYTFKPAYEIRCQKTSTVLDFHNCVNLTTVR